MFQRASLGELIDVAGLPSFYMLAGDLNPGPHTCVAYTSGTLPSPQALLQVF